MIPQLLIILSNEENLVVAIDILWKLIDLSYMRVFTTAGHQGYPLTFAHTTSFAWKFIILNYYELQNQKYVGQPAFKFCVHGTGSSIQIGDSYPVYSYFGCIMDEEDNFNAFGMMEEVEEDISKTDFSYVSKHPYISKVFCWIESGETEEVKRFFNTFPHLLASFHSPNNWNPLLYAVRYGNMELIDYFAEKNANHTISGILNTISIVHTGVYSGEPKILEYIFQKLPLTANPQNSEIPPLKAAIKATNSKMVEFLVSRGAYYVFSDVYNNLDTHQEENTKYISLPNSPQQQAKDIPQNMVVDEAILRDCPIKEVLRYARVKNVMSMRKYAKKFHNQGHSRDHKFQNLAAILSNDDYFNLMMKTTVNKGESIFKKGATSNHTE